MFRLIKFAVFCACLVPLALLAWRFFGPHPTDMTSWGAGLGPNPVEALEHGTGDWTIRFLLITLAVTPARKILRVPALIKFRRMFGLFAFFYGCLHFATYIGVDKFFNIHEIFADVLKRKYITVGFAGFVLLIPLAVTSTAGWIRRLGGKRWQALHRLVYLSAIAGIIHYLWLVKLDIRTPMEYEAVLIALLGYRAFVWLRPRLQAARAARAGASVPAQ